MFYAAAETSTTARRRERLATLRASTRRVS